MRDLKDTKEFNDTFGAMMTTVASAPGFESWLREINQTWQFSVSEPTAQVTCVFRSEGPLKVHLDPTEVAADLRISIAAMDAHRYLLGELNGFREIDEGRISIEGSPVEFLRTIPRIRQLIAPAYRDTLRRQGRDSLLPAFPSPMAD